jgi:hypothetical protein
MTVTSDRKRNKECLGVNGSAGDDIFDGDEAKKGGGRVG